jgi:glycine/D-amino acid oxidase-like deaminating enzyme
VLCGTSGHGFKLAPAIGRALADVLTESRAAAPELAPFRLDRLANPLNPPGLGVLA